MDWIRGRNGGRVGATTYVLIAVLGVVLFGVHSMEQKGRELRRKARAAGAGAAVPAVAVAVGVKMTPSTETAAGWGRDPFERSFPSGDEAGPSRSPLGRGTAATGLYLQGVIEGPMGRGALINGDICREGERVGAYEVLRIGKGSVVLLQNGSVKTLTLKGEAR